jgi:hypothetical protein
MNRFAVIPTYGRECLHDCIEAIRPQVDHIFLIGHNFEPDILPDDCTLIPYNVEVPNISTMWNLGIDAAHELNNFHPSLVAVLNDDAIVGPDWFFRVEKGILENRAVLGCMSEVDRLYLQTEHSNHLPRLSGFAFIINAAFGIRLDEQFQWWWGDTDLDWQARRAGGLVVVPGEIDHRFPNGTTTGILAEIAGQDRERFIAKWGSAPW